MQSLKKGTGFPLRRRIEMLPALLVGLSLLFAAQAFSTGIFRAGTWTGTDFPQGKVSHSTNPSTWLLSEIGLNYPWINTENLKTSTPSVLKTVVGVKGSVMDENGAPLLGVSVMVKGSTLGTTTDAQGSFTLNVPDANATLVFSAVGHITKEEPLNGRTELVVVLATSRETLDQVIVVGYGTSTKRDLTAPVVSVNTADLAKRTTPNPMGALQGSVSGVQVVTSGAPGASPTVRIRGVGSLNNEAPLYVVDGMFVDNIDFLNTDDIGEMSVLKDASAAAIYGVRAANGVVLITTKKGKLNMKTKVTYNGYVGFQTPVNMLKMANGQQYAAMQLAKNTKSDSARVLSSVSNFGGSGVNPSTNTDWYNELLRKKAVIHSHGIDLAGGSNKVTYTLGLNYLYQDGIMKAKNDYERYNIRLQTEAKAFDWLKVGYTVHFSNYTLFSANNGAFTNAYYVSPLYPVYDPKNTLADPVKFATSTTLGYNNGVYNNPVASAFFNYDRTKAFQVLPTVYAEANIIGNKLVFRTQLSQKYGSNHNINYIPQYYVDNNQRSALSKLTSTQDRYTNFILDNLLTYKSGKDQHHWTVLLGNSVREERWRQTRVSADSVPNVPEFWYVTQGKTSANGYSENGSRNAGISYFARASYDFANKYLLTATLRADGSSKYQTKWGYFPSIGAGWVVSSEEFMKNQKLFDFLKLRASWGKLGNDGIPPNAGYAIVNTGNRYSGIFGSTGGANGVYIPGYTIQSFFTAVGWEVVDEFDGGLDFTLLEQRLKGSVDYYHRMTNNMAFSRRQPFTNVEVYGNWGKALNEGVEVNLDWSDKIGDLGYKIGGNLTTLKNKVVDLGGIDYYSTGIAEFPTRMQVGMPMNYFLGYQMIGIYQTQAQIDADPIAKANNAKPGYMMYKDQDGNNILDAKDRVNLGNYLPKVTYGFNLGLDYKNFDFSMMWQGQGGNKILNLNRALRSKYSDMNGDAAFVGHLWTGPGSTNAYPSAYATTQGFNNQASSFYVENGSYLRIQNIQLGYNFKLGNQQNAPGLRVYVTADRPVIFTRYSGFTPEVTSTDTRNVANYGYDSNIYPVSATYSLGVRLSF